MFARMGKVGLFPLKLQRKTGVQLGSVAKLRRIGLILIAVMIILFLVAIAILAPIVAPHDPFSTNLEEKVQGPSYHHPLGTDQLGRDLFSRILYGTRISLTVAFATVAACMVLGVGVGTVAGYFGGIVDEILMRLVDVLMAFPGLILTIAVAGILGPSLQNLMLAMTVTSWGGYARIARGSVLSVKEHTFVEAAKALGSPDWRVIVDHIVPNTIHPVLVMATLNMGHTILSIAGLSFLGLGAQPPTPEWGTMLNEARSFMGLAPHLFIFPGLAIMITVLAFNFLGDGLRDILDPRIKEDIKV